MRHGFFAFAFAATLALTGPVLAQSEEDVLDSIESIHGDVDGFNEAFALLQDAFLFDDPTSIADLGFYPLAINANGETYDVLEAQDLVDNFDSLLTEETQDALAGQDYADLIVTSEGVGLANGALWMTNICLDDDCAETEWGILSINN